MKSFQIRSFSGPYFPVFNPNPGKYGPEKTPCLDIFRSLITIVLLLFLFYLLQVGYSLIVCSYHVTYAFQSESTLWLNGWVFLYEVWATLAKWLSVRLRTNWLCVRVPLQGYSFLCPIFVSVQVLSKLNSKVINQFHSTGLFLYPLKTSQNQVFSDIFKGYRRREWVKLIYYINLLD